MNTPTNISILSVTLLTGMTFIAGAADSLVQPPPTSTNSMGVRDLGSPQPTIWEDGIGRGFLASAQTLSVEAGVASGVACFGGEQSHNLGLLSIAYGHMLGGVKGQDHWYRGNFEGRLELFGGMQSHPDVDTDGWFVGLTPHLRYNFATGSRWIPFFDVGAGVTATGIGQPDLSGTFEFNLQATTGIHYFLCDNLALTGDVRYMHMSCAGIHKPNLGMNDVVFMLGLTWFFGK